MTTSEDKYTFTVEVTNYSKRSIDFDVHPPEEFNNFNIEEQGFIASFILSQYETQPVFNAKEDPAGITDDVVLTGLAIDITLTMGAGGFNLNINGPDSIMKSSFAPNISREIHKALLAMEANYVKAVS